MLDAKKGLSTDQLGIVKMWAKKHLSTLERHGWNFALYPEPYTFLENTLASAMGIYSAQSEGQSIVVKDGLTQYLLQVKHHEVRMQTPERERLFPSIMWRD